MDFNYWIHRLFIASVLIFLLTSMTLARPVNVRSTSNLDDTPTVCFTAK